VKVTDTNVNKIFELKRYFKKLFLAPYRSAE